MCFRRTTIGIFLVAMGIGLILSVFFSSMFWPTFLGIVLVAAGVLVSRSR